MRKITEVRFCKRCGKSKTIIDKFGYAHWNHTEQGLLCHQCYNIVKGYTRKHWTRRNARRNKLKLAFLGRIVVLTFDPRKHVCSRCDKQGFTHMNHLMYIPCMPWACTEELCASCHGV